MKFPSSKLNTYFKSKEFFPYIISVWGDFGVGKTTFALQTAIESAEFGNNVIFFYTKPNLPYDKMKLISKGVNMKLDNLHIILINNFDELHKVIFNFEFLILKLLQEEKKKINLIIIDSLTNLYRIELNKDKKEKNYNLNYKLNQILANLYYLNQKYRIEVLVVNEISRKNSSDQINEIQSGGKVMEYWINMSIKIVRINKLNERKFIVYKKLEGEILNFNLEIQKTGFKIS